jgi:ABC-type glycerol-3-phosphate transport system substrate-binding protein
MESSLSKKLNRRQLLVGMGLVGAGAILAACGDDEDVPAAPGAQDDTDPVDDDDDVEDTDDVADVDDPDATTLRFMRFAGPAWIHDTEFVDRFMDENPNIVVEAEDVVYGEMFTKAQAMAATDQLADVVSGHSRWTPFLAYRGFHLQLDDLVDEHHDEIEFDDFFPSVIDDARFQTGDGNLYWLPTVVHSGGNAVIMFNMDLMDQVGLEPPTDPDWTLEDYREYAYAAQEELPSGIWGTWLNTRTPLYAQQYLRSFGTDPEVGSDDAWLLARDQQTMQTDTEPIREGLEWFATMVRDGVAPPESEKQALEGTGVSTFTAGQALTRAREVGGPITDRLAVEDRFEIYAWIFPRGPHGHRGSALSYNNQAIWSETQHPEESFQLASYLTGPEIAIWTPLEGALQAMARRSAWFSDELHERYPFKAQVAEWFDTHVDPFPNPHNFRFIEWQQIYENETFEYFNGNESFEDMQPRLQERCQAVLDLGPPS